MALTLYLLRHGETASSASGGFCGSIDPDLTPEGHLMAEDFGKAYAGHPFKAAYVSPMQRARKTATPLCTANGLEMNIRPGLSEVSFGEWEGKTNYGEWMWVSGTTGFNYETMTISEDVAEQADQALRNIQAAMEKGGFSLDDVVSVTYIFPRAEDFEPCWPLFRQYFDQSRPAATMISAGLLDPRIRIEIEVIGTGGEFIWQTSDEFDFSIQVDPKLHRSSLICNGMNQGHKSICLLDVPEGPWRARMSYTQQQGVNKQIRFMRVY